MTGRLLAATALLAMLVLSACAKSEDVKMTEHWKSPLYRDHPLAGRIWKPADGRYATADEINAALKKADFVLIGEKHDNVDHHALQARLVSEMAALGRRPALVFEMLTESQQAALDAHLANNPGDAAGIGAAVGWEKTGWPDWKTYQPIAEQALDNNMPLLAGGLDRDMTRRIAREGNDALGKEHVISLMLDLPVAEDTRTDMREVISDSHCGQLPELMLDPMLSVTLAKDAVMANRMVEVRGPQTDVAVLIAGGGHVRMDWGVPMHLKRRAPNARIVTVGFAEVEKGVLDPIAHAKRHDGAAPFDFVWFTPRVDDDDPCEAYADQLRKMGKNGPGTSDGENK